MEIHQFIGYILAVLVGLSLGLIGSGGSILTVPILVYIMAINPITATGYSLFVVGSSALVGGVRNALKSNVDFKTAAIFGLPSLVAAYLTRAYIIPAIPNTIYKIESFSITKPLVMMVLFAVVMLIASLRMIESSKRKDTVQKEIKPSLSQLLLSGVFTGLLAGAVGAGGGFIIIPALIFLAGLPMKKAVGTSLIIIAIQSMAGFMGDLGNTAIDWSFLLLFSLASVIGIFIGMYLSKKIPGEKLKSLFGWFVLIMGVYILSKELFF